MGKENVARNLKLTETPDLSKAKFITAIFPGSFDPPTNGHLDIVRKASMMYDKVIWAIGVNPRKTQKMFTLSECLEMMKGSIKDLKNVSVAHFKDALVDFARREKAQVIIRSFRTIADMEYEKEMVSVNEDLAPDIITVFILVDKKYNYISSSMVRELIALGKDVERYVPEYINEVIKRKFKFKK
jgi:pantetheine-phosphate adenylyltransferase